MTETPRADALADEIGDNATEWYLSYQYIEREHIQQAIVIAEARRLNAQLTEALEALLALIAPEVSAGNVQEYASTFLVVEQARAALKAAKGEA